ncbi:MAG TPA: hypothetical protein PKE27_05030 [Povalibacter sp.]|uniref:arsenic resistance protein n=1 Tax=Povalibacter sp. TaxID=1962978 RepID=UPI002BCBB56A|nr:hypothetical protein [Povalibacter sp.]HMN43911.1 hypothetical protein [Povalibacter sp.]
MSRDWLERHQVVIYFAVIVLAIACGLASGSLRALEMLITPAIAVLMYAMFLQIPFLGLRAALADRRFMAALLTANFVLIPLLVWLITLPLTDHRALLIGASLVLLTPCIDYVVVFTHLGKGDSKLILSATPVLLVLQFALLPVYLPLMLSGEASLSVPSAPFLEAFLLLIIAPLGLAIATEWLSDRAPTVRAWRNAWLWLPVPAMSAVLFLVIGSQIDLIAQDAGALMPVLPVYIGFAILAPMAGALAARLYDLHAEAARAVAFSSATRNSLVVLPLALALPDELRLLAASAVVAQTIVELTAELIYLRVIPRSVGSVTNLGGA